MLLYEKLILNEKLIPSDIYKLNDDLGNYVELANGIYDNYFNELKLNIDKKLIPKLTKLKKYIKNYEYDDSLDTTSFNNIFINDLRINAKSFYNFYLGGNKSVKKNNFTTFDYEILNKYSKDLLKLFEIQRESNKTLKSIDDSWKGLTELQGKLTYLFNTSVIDLSIQLNRNKIQPMSNNDFRLDDDRYYYARMFYDKSMLVQMASSNKINLEFGDIKPSRIIKFYLDIIDMFILDHEFISKRIPILKDQAKGILNIIKLQYYLYINDNERLNKMIVDKFTYRGVKFYVEYYDYNEIDYRVKLIKIAIDKLSKEGFDKLLSTCNFTILTNDSFKKYHGGKNYIRFYAYYVIQDRTIVMPYNRNLDDDEGKHFLFTIYHEFGHHVHLSIKNKEVYDNWLEIYKHLMKNKNLLPSEYSGKDEKELFAEIFGYVMFPNYRHNKIPMDLFQAFRNVIRGMHNISFREKVK